MVGITNIIAAGLLFLFAIIKKTFLTFDPLDSDFICYELSINLTSFYGLDKISKVISKKYFINFIENKIEQQNKLNHKRIETNSEKLQKSQEFSELQNSEILFTYRGNCFKVILGLLNFLSVKTFRRFSELQISELIFSYKRTWP